MHATTERQSGQGIIVVMLPKLVTIEINSLLTFKKKLGKIPWLKTHSLKLLYLLLLLSIEKFWENWKDIQGLFFLLAFSQVNQSGLLHKMVLKQSDMFGQQLNMF